MINLYDLQEKLETDFVWASNGGSNDVQKVTADAIAEHVRSGYTIYVGNNPFMDRSGKWSNHHLVRLSQVNSTRHGKSIRTIWAVK